MKVINKQPCSVSILILISIVSLVQADQVLWEYDLTELPSGWTAEPKWTFSAAGMNCYFYYFDQMTGDNDVITTLLTVPEGTDSLTLSVQQQYSAMCWGSGIVSARLAYWTSQTDWVGIWQILGAGQNSTPIDVSITTLAPGIEVKFRFRGSGGAYGSFCGSVLDWTLHDLVLTAFGDIQELTPSTWGVIKALGSAF